MESHPLQEQSDPPSENVPPNGDHSAQNASTEQQIEGSTDANACAGVNQSADHGKSYSDAVAARHATAHYYLRSNANTTPRSRVDFYLYVDTDDQVDQAGILFSFSENPVSLYRISSVRDGKLWGLSYELPHDLVQERISYNYCLFNKGSVSNLPVVGRFFNKDPSQHFEVGRRGITSHVQHDVFHFNDDSSYYSATVPNSLLFYINWLLQFVKDANINEILEQLGYMNFSSLNMKAVRKALAWVLEQAASPSVNDVQRLYLCVIIGYLASNYTTRTLPFLDDRKTRIAVDRLLQCLDSCAHTQLLSPSNVKLLEKIAPDLVESSSSPGWLTLAMHFYPYLGVHYVIHRRRTEGKYDKKEYLQMVYLLLSHVTIGEHEESAHRQLLQRILKAAPDQDTVLQLFENHVIGNFFSSEDGKEDFFVGFYQESHSGKSETAGETLVKLMKIPEKLRERMCRLVHSSLTEFAKSSDELKEQHVKAFFQLMVSSRHLSIEQIYSVLSHLSKAKSKPHHNLLLEFLNNKQFESDWHKITLSQKVTICTYWVVTKVADETRKGTIERTTTVYQGIEDIMLCSLNVSNKALAEDLCASVVDKVLKSEDAGNILKAFRNVENFSEVVQQCYKNHVKILLQREPRLLRSSSKILKQYSLSSLGQNLLFCVLDVMNSPSSKGNISDEDSFRKMLDWIDVWITLLSAQESRVQKHKTFKAGKDIWCRLLTCITEGDLSLEFLKDVTQRQEKLSFICSILHVQINPGSEHEDWQKKYFDRISKLAKIEEDCSRKLDLLGSAIKYGKKVACDVYPLSAMNQVITEFNQRNDSWRSKKLNELASDTFWGPLLPLLNPADSLQPLMKCVSFMNVAKACLQEEYNVDAANTEDDEPTPKDFYLLAKILTGKAIERLQAQWNPIFSNPGSLPFETMKTLLGSLKNEKKLEEEFIILETYFNRRFPAEVKLYVKDYVKYPGVVKQVKHVLGILETFGLTDPSNETVSSLKTFKENAEDIGELSLKTLHESTKSVEKIFLAYTGDEIDGVVEELGTSSELLAFLEHIVDEDIRFLIDAVEEHSDQFVSESSVSDLIDVHGFLAPLIKKRRASCDAKQFLGILKESCIAHKNMAIKIHQCSTNVNSLKGLYTSVANRGEITKEIIARALKRGHYIVDLKPDGTCEANLSYMYEKNEKNGENMVANYSLSDVHDLRSRAHLIVSSDKNASKISANLDHAKEIAEDINYTDFIKQVNLLTEITVLLSKLRSSGYVKYRKFWKKMKGTDALDATKIGLEKDLTTWEDILSSARERYYFLNYYRSDQLCVLHDFLTCRAEVNSEDVLSLTRFVDPNIKMKQLEEYRQTHPVSKKTGSDDSPDKMVSLIGDALDDIFNSASHAVRLIQHEEELSSYQSKFDAIVKSGELFVASLDAESPQTANVILTLYENTSNAFPEPYQVVFCDSQTEWEEIHLVLQRCFSESKHLKRKSLFCIANVELLPNEVQFRMVNAIKEKQNGNGPDCCEENSDYRLTLICRGGDHHHIVEQFAQYSHHIAGMSDVTLSERLRRGWPEVTMVTSTLPGLGKTERIRKEVLKKNMNVVTFSISGPADQRKLIQRLKKFKLKKYHCLHLDIGEVSDPLWLDTFLFQLIVTGMVSSGTLLYHLLTTHVYMEIANTLKDWLRESLVISKYFTRIHLQWKNYEDLLVSSEITSDLQVVCHYFDAFDRARLESQDIHFSRSNKVKPLPAYRCRELLRKYYSSDADISFTALNTFLGVLADQLLKFSKSAFFKIANLKSMLGDGSNNVRTNLFRALLDVSKEFASRSITTCRSSGLSQKDAADALDKAVSSSGMSAKHMVERVDGMIRWEDSNHLLVVFHGINSHAIAAVYRNRSLVPNNVEKLLKSQAVRGKNKELEDFKVMTQEQLQEKLEKIACTKPVKDCKINLNSSYALTPDNILKMILIILRVRASAPIIIMGETGCGKTSLVRYLANTCQIPFSKFDFHAGISEEEIIKFIVEKENEAQDSGQQMWVFLDEINTCEHLGLISDIMCHNALLGRPLSNNLVFLAACNPYKLRPTEHVKTAGLEGKNITDEYSGLVYRVHSLPEAMIDYVWDYGTLSPNDEKAYIQRMVRTLPTKYRGMLVSLLTESQKFTRAAEKNDFCVSLRDVYRCIRLIQWFKEMIDKREQVNSGKEISDPTHLRKYRIMSEGYNDKPLVKSIVLALAHCYLSRLPTDELRNSYRRRMMTFFCGNGVMMTTKEEVDSFSAIVRMEEEDYLDRMELPPGTARNAALRENVFVMLVCILNRIPVFVVGKPGCSKSLSIQLIRSNLRGRDSKDPLFRRLPQLYVVSYQGSESSTSEGIIKVFDKARKYKSHNKDGNVLPVVLLDEVGLAENSKYNPLKVLHSLLEPGDGQVPDVAVVGISNWSLDAAKMNRAIHLSRPEPTKDDLYETGYSLHYADAKDKGDDNQSFGNEELRCLAEAYFEYQSNQKHANFHGLRDYYSLIKSLSLSGGGDMQQMNMALQRNFGGIPGELTNIQKIFLDKLKKCMLSSGKAIIPVTKLIQENLNDPRARHLMLITSGDSAIGILKQTLNQLKRETITIFGSRFEEDLSEDYNYRILSRIILCMERDCILILRDLENIYGSLYDMLNQNYAVVGKRKNCRVALGAYSNPMCHVNDNFRCIVLTDHHKVDFSDPPFLNRFEKQLLRFSDVLDERQQEVIEELQHWVKQIAIVPGFESQFDKSDMFIGFHDDTLPSLVLSRGQDIASTTEEIIQKCKDDLMWVAAPDGVLRTQKCNLLKENWQEVRRLTEDYFKKPIHQGFSAFMKIVISDEAPFITSDEIGSKTIVMTFSNIHTDIPKCLGVTIKCQAERLSAYKSEKQLAERINHFWTTSENELLVLQCKPELDGAHLLLARSIIEEKRSVYEQDCKETRVKQRKHVCIVVHVQRAMATDSVPWQFSFLCGWKQVFLDVLEAPPISLNQIRNESVQELLTSSIWPLRNIAQNDLLWCFTCIKYAGRQRPLDSILNITKSLFSSEKVCCTIEQILLQWLAANGYENDHEEGLNDRWQVKVACDRQALINSSTLYCAMEQFVSRLIREPLAKMVYFLESKNAWPPHVFCQSEDDTLRLEFEDLWCKLLLKDDIFNMAEIPKPLGAESYVLDSRSLQLSLPFSQVVIGKVDALKELFLEDNAQDMKYIGNIDETGHLTQQVQLQQVKRYSEIISNLVPEIHGFPASCQDSYMADLFDMMTADFSTELNRFQRVSAVKAVFAFKVGHSLQVKDTVQSYVQLHIFSWTHKEYVLDQLRMVTSCQKFIDPKVLNQLTNEYLSNQDKVLQPSNESNEAENEEEIESVEHQTLESAEDDSLVSSVQSAEGAQSVNTLTEPETEYEDKVAQKDGKNDGSLGHNLLKDELLENKDSGENAASQVHETHDHAEETCDEVPFGELEHENEDSEQSENIEQKSHENSEEKHDKEQESWEDLLVTAYCEQMLPSQETVETNNGFESWIRNANLLLSLVFRISDQTPAFHFLRLCVDFAKIVSTSSNFSEKSWYSLFTLNKLGEYLKAGGYLDSDEAFDVISDNLIKELEKQVKAGMVEHEAVQKFAALFYGRCLDTNVDTGGARPIVEQVLSLDSPGLVVMMGPVLLRLLIVEEMQSPGVFANLITNPSVIENCPCLQNIDEVFKELFSDESIHHDSYPAVMICDLIQSLLSFDDRYSIDEIDSSDCKLLLTANSAVRALSEYEEDHQGLVILSAVAFLRAFFTMLSRFIAEKQNVLKVNSAYSQVIMEISSLLTANTSRSISLRLFFLKQLYQNMSFFELCKLCRESEMLPAIKDVWNNENVVDKAQLGSVCKLPEYEEVKAAYWKLTNDDESAMLNILTQRQNSPNCRLALLGILVNMIYLKRAVKKLTDKEERLADWFFEKATILPSPLKELLLRVIGRKDFKCPQLQLSPESSVNEVETALLVLHTACVIASGVQNENSPMYQYFSAPPKSKQTFILAHGKDRVHRVFEDRQSPKGPSPLTCCCGVRIIFKDHQKDKRCPYCGERTLFDPEKANDSSVGSTTTPEKSPPLTTEEPRWDDCTSELNPPVYRALHLLVYATLYAGVAIESFSSEELSLLLSKPDMKQGTSSETKDPSQVCFDHVTTDLSYLMIALSCKKAVAIKVMHLVVEKCTELIRGPTFGINDCLTAKQRLSWEVEFGNLTKEAFSVTTVGFSNIKKMMTLPKMNENELSTQYTLPDQILEIDSYPTELGQQNQQLKRLFRLTRQPTFEEFRAIFMNSPKHFQEKHSFLVLFFARFDALPNIGNLYHLLNWSRVVSSALTHRISRKNSQSKTINDFITGHLLELDRGQEEMENHKKLFSSFKEAWNEVRPLVNQHLSNTQKQMPRLRETDHIAYCLTESDSGIYLLTAIKILVSFQNSILDEMLALSVLKHPALKFLEKDGCCSGVPSVSIQEVKEKEIIEFHWSDDLFKYAQNNPDYGKGEEINYDFERMEVEIASHLAFGKCYLIGTLNKFIFSNELFHSCGPLLTEIRELFPQTSNLPDDVRQGLSSLKARRIKEAQDLLQHIEVLIFLLKLKLKNLDVEMTLETFAESWLSMLPSPFPVALLPGPRHSIKLKHVAAFYEALEDMLADGAIEGLADQFREDLSDETKDKLDSLVDKESGQLKLQSLLIALRRFVFRYLSSEKYLPEGNATLSSCLKEPSLWSPGQTPDLKVIPKDITLENIHSVVTRLLELDKASSRLL